MANFFYNLIIYPLYQIIEVVYLVVWKVFKNSGYAVIGISIAVTFLCLPLYIIAEKWQQVERDKQKEMKSGIDRIKSVFKGDEQYMILSTFYKQHHYHPLMALRSSISLLIQIPFFMAAYKYLSELEELRGFSFYFIKDMGAPDAMFHIGSFPINVLPIAMTLINILAGAIYCKGLGWKEKGPIYGMALLFLVILYNSPAGLVLYWTMNNVFSLVKNIFYKLKNPIWILYGCLCASVLAMDYYVFFHHHGFLHRRLMLIGAISIILFAPLIIKLINYLLDKVFKELLDDTKITTALFFSSAITLCILMGYTLPSFVIASSPAEFSFIDSYKSPFFFLFNGTCQMAGLFLVWFTCIYYLFNKKIKAILAILLSIMTFSALINCFIFGGDYGMLSPILAFSDAGKLKASSIRNLINLLILFIPLLVICLLIFFKKTKILNYIIYITCFALIAISFVNSITISKGYKKTKNIIETTQKTSSTVSPIFHLSKTDKNVVVIMMDRAVSAFVPQILIEKPELNNIYEGFTYYPNTVSFAGHTLIGVPPIVGGYDYTPVAINKRDTENLVDKHNEALLMVPQMFNEIGYKITVSDPSWANYSWIPDLRIYDNYPYITTTNTIRRYTDIWLQNHPETTSSDVRSTLMKRNFVWYSLLKCMPTLFRDTIYNDGFYWNTNKTLEDLQDVVNNYAALDYLPELTDFTVDGPTYTYLENELTHEPAFLQAPNYTPVEKVTDYGNGPFNMDVHYHANISTLLRLGEWLEYLKENNVYDNTRIIIVSDHAVGVKNDRFSGSYPVDPCMLNPLLLVKDFGATGSLKTDNTFMSNADVPWLSMEGIIENPVNKATGNKINGEKKKNGLVVVSSSLWSPDGQNKTTFKLDNDQYYYVKDNIINPENWKKITPEEAMKGDF